LSNRFKNALFFQIESHCKTPDTWKIDDFGDNFQSQLAWFMPQLRGIPEWVDEEMWRKLPPKSAVLQESGVLKLALEFIEEGSGLNRRFQPQAHGLRQDGK